MNGRRLHVSLGGQLLAQVETGLARQAEAYGTRLHAEAVERRSRDPLALFLMDTFTRQVRDFGRRALEAHGAGDRARAVELALSCERAGENRRRVQAAIEGTDDGIAAQAGGVPNWQRKRA